MAHIFDNVVMQQYKINLSFTIFKQLFFARTFSLRKSLKEYVHDQDLINVILSKFDLGTNTFPHTFLAKDPVILLKIKDMVII